MAIIIPTIVQPAAKAAACNTSAGPALARLLAIAMFLAGGGMLVGMLSMQDHARRSQAWPTTSGRVVDTRVERQSGDDNKKYRPIIRYAYAVNGNAFESERYSFGSKRRSKNAAEELCAVYPPGTEVQVHYDPARPAEAVLVVQPAGGFVPLGIFGVLLMAAGAFVFTLSFRSLPSLAAPSAASA